MPPTDSLRSGVAAPLALGPAPNTDSRGLTIPSSVMAPPPPPMPSTLGRTIAAAALAELAAADEEVPSGEAFCLSCGSFVSDDACAQGEDTGREVGWWVGWRLGSRLLALEVAAQVALQ